MRYGLYAEQLSGSAFTKPHPERTWCYRIRPSVKHTTRFERTEVPHWKSAPHVLPDVTSLGQYRWDPVPHSSEPQTWVTGMRTVTTAGDVNTQAGMASHVYLVTQSMQDEYSTPPMANCWWCRRRAACGSVRNWASLIWNRRKSPCCRAGWSTGSRCWKAPARGFVCENYGPPYTLPNRGPIGANCLANPRDFKTPVAAFEDREVASSVVVLKWCGQFHRTQDRPQPAGMWWHGMAITDPTNTICGPIRRLVRDPVRSSRPVDLYRADRTPRGWRGRRTSTSCCSANAGWWPSIQLPSAVVPQERHVPR